MIYVPIYNKVWIRRIHSRIFAQIVLMASVHLITRYAIFAYLRSIFSAYLHFSIYPEFIEYFELYFTQISSGVKRMIISRKSELTPRYSDDISYLKGIILRMVYVKRVPTTELSIIATLAIRHQIHLKQILPKSETRFTDSFDYPPPSANICVVPMEVDIRALTVSQISSAE